MNTIPLPNWRNAFGPLDLKMPVDLAPTLIDWEAAFANGEAHEHQDWADRLNSDGTWGTSDPSYQGGSGIAFGYSTSDLDAVHVACKALQKTTVLPDNEHAIRRILYPMAGFEMTHDAYYARRVQQSCVKSLEWFPTSGDVVLDDPGWFPTNLDNLLAYATAHPGQGLIKTNLRALGWTAYSMAMWHKCARVLGAPVDPAWMQKYLHIMELAAMPTGAIALGTEADPAHPLDQIQSEYTFHWSINAIGAMACANRLHKPIPPWIVPHMERLSKLPSILYYGSPSVPAFTFSVGSDLIVATGSGQQGDPAFGNWGSLCVAIDKFLPNQGWLDRATQWGPTTAGTEEDRKMSMLYRGATT